MDIEFVWNRPTRTVAREALESEIRGSLEDHPVLVPCHPGKIQIYLSSADRLEVTIEGRAVCQCSKDFGSLSYSSDRQKLISNPPNESMVHRIP
jgi:hypothetical protein